MAYKLAELLLRRKELATKVGQLGLLKDKKDYFETVGKRVKVTDSIDDLLVMVPKLSASQVMHEFDWHARQLRIVDAAIQQANWATDVSVPESAMAEYVAPALPVVVQSKEGSLA